MIFFVSVLWDFRYSIYPHSRYFPWELEVSDGFSKINVEVDASFFLVKIA